MFSWLVLECYVFLGGGVAKINEMLEILTYDLVTLVSNCIFFPQMYFGLLRWRGVPYKKEQDIQTNALKEEVRVVKLTSWF